MKQTLHCHCEEGALPQALSEVEGCPTKQSLFFLFVLSVLFVLFPVVAQAQSHASEQLDCSKCHTCAAPTADDPCLVACPRLQSVHATGAHSLGEGPDSVVLGKIADMYLPVHFNHKGHAGMAQMGTDCQTCHHFSPPGRIPPCGECHKTEAEANLRQPSLKGAYHRQCLACHREWSHDTQCVICHAPQPGKAMAEAVGDMSDIMGAAHPKLTEPDTKVYQTPYEKGPVVTFFHKEHIDLFGLRCVDCHKQENCSRCHDLQAPVKVAKTQEEMHTLCNDCHKSDPCAKCHGTEQKTGFTHARTGWPLNRYHADLDCRACHPTGKQIARLNNSCGSCHAGWTQANFKHAVTGLQLDEIHREIDCTDCHTNRQYSAAPNCAGCHDDGRSAKDVPPGEMIGQ